MTTFLLDANVLIALTVAEHEHHEAAGEWMATASGFAVCPIVEGSLVRFLVRIGERAAAARQVVADLRRVPGYEFWPDSRSYADTPLDHVIGHRQVTDAYLLGLVTARDDAKLATFDQALARTVPGATELVASG